MATPSTAPGIGVPGSDLGWALGVILRRWHEQVERAVEDLPHGPRGFQILSIIGHNAPPTQSGLANHLNIDKTVMPYIMDSLEQAGLLTRQTDAVDRRVKRIVITPRGRSVLAELEERVRSAEVELFQDVSPEFHASFREQALRLAMSVHATDPLIDPCIAVMDVLTEQPARAAGPSRG